MTDLQARATVDAEPLSTLRRGVVGILLVAVDINLGRFDVLPDPLGYLLIALALGPLVPLHRGFGWARNAAVVGVVSSTAGLLLRTLDPDSRTVVENPVTSIADAVIEAVVVVALCTALIALCRSPRVVGPARTLRWALPCVSVGGGLLGLVAVLAGARWSDAGSSGTTEVLGGLLALAGIVLVVSGIVLGIWFLLVLWRASREPVASAGPALR